MPKITGFHHVAIHSTGFDASVRFYAGVLGLTPKIAWGDPGKRAIMLDSGAGNYIEIFEFSEPAGRQESAILHFALRTDNCSEMLEKVRQTGATVTMEPKEVTIDSSIGPVPVKIAFFKGPDGEIVELFENSVL